MEKNVVSKKIWTRFDERDYPIQTNLYLKSLWKLQHSEGRAGIHKFLTAVTVNAYEIEVAKFDVGVEGGSHYHHQPNYGIKRKFASTHIIEQVKEVRGLLNNNLQQYLTAHKNTEIRNMVLNTSAIELPIKNACQDILRYCIQRDILIPNQTKVPL